MNTVLYETDLVKKILDTYKESNVYKLENTQHTVTSGYMAFIRKLANKLVTVSKKQEEVVNFLDSIPEWSDFVSVHLDKQNELETKQLGNKKVPLAAAEDDDDSDDNNNDGESSLNSILFKINSIGGVKQNNDDESDSSDEDDQAQLFENTSKGPLTLDQDDSSSDEDADVADQLAANYSSNYAAASAPVVQVYQEEKPEYHAQFFWKQEVTDVTLDDLLLDYE